MISFSQSVQAIIEKRTSIRTYALMPLIPEVRGKLESFIYSPITSPFGHKARFRFLEISLDDANEKHQLGTYGFISGAQYFIAGATERNPFDLEHYGYAMEQIVLYATDLGLGTCWLGGTFNKTGFSQRMELEENEFVPAITPVGYAAEKRRFFENIMRWNLGAKLRKPWASLFFAENFDTPLSDSDLGNYKIALEMVRLGPSARNGQPWRIVYDKKSNSFHFFIKKLLNGNIKRVAGYSRLDLGIAIAHFDLFCNEKQLPGKWTILNSSPLKNDEFHYEISWIAQ